MKTTTTKFTCEITTTEPMHVDYFRDILDIGYIWEVKVIKKEDVEMEVDE